MLEGYMEGDSVEERVSDGVEEVEAGNSVEKRW